MKNAVPDKMVRKREKLLFPGKEVFPLSPHPSLLFKKSE